MVPEDNDIPDGAIFVSKPFSSHVIYNHLQVILPDGKKPEPLKKWLFNSRLKKCARSVNVTPLAYTSDQHCHELDKRACAL